jgi:hypothetical protein
MASLVLKKLANYPRQNGLAKALRGIGKIERSLFGLDWYQDLELRRRVNVGLSKGEARNALARCLLQPPGRAQGPLLRGPAGMGQRTGAADGDDSTLERGLPRTGRGGAPGEEVAEEYLRHLSPLEWEHVTLTGVYQ